MWKQALAEFQTEFLARGYSQAELSANFVGAHKFSDRQRLLERQEAKGGSAPVLALKLPYTPRTKHLEAPSFLQLLKAQAEEDPRVSELLSGARWLVAHRRTSNLRARPEVR